MLGKAVCALLTVVAVALASSAAAAQTKPNRVKPPFSVAEEIVIARNDALAALLPIDPSGVRKILDALAAAKRSRPAAAADPGRVRDVTGDPRLRDGDFRLDPLQNPDLKVLFQRASPEAAYDLFQILKQAGGKAAAN
jgi:hypothetical protein